MAWTIRTDRRVNADKAVQEAIRRRDAKNNPKPVVEDNVATGQGLFKFTVERQPSQGWAVQVGVFKQYGNVLVAAEKIQREFDSSVVVNINELRGETVYKVLIGPFQNKSSATTIWRKLLDRGDDAFVASLKNLK